MEKNNADGCKRGGSCGLRKVEVFGKWDKFIVLTFIRRREVWKKTDWFEMPTYEYKQDARHPVCSMHNLFICNQLAVENGL